MAAPRATLSFPHLFRAIRSCEPRTYRSLRATSINVRRITRQLQTTQLRAQDTHQQRYGPAVTPSLPPPSKPSETLKTKNSEPKRKASNQDSSKDATAQSDPSTKPSKESSTAKKADLDIGKTASAETPQSSEKKPENEPLGTPELDLVLAVPTPSELKKDPEHRHPHLEASPYEHHFDTYSLVQQLAKEGCFTEDQAVTIMKSVRLMLANNLDIAKEGLVSKSDVENETYLFRAACSELSTTLSSGRQAETQRQRSSRAQLQHEFDILNQKVTQDLASMREELKAMFNDHKQTRQEDKRKTDTKISELNYEITVLLNSDSKSEVEGLRWVLTRRATLAIVTSACTFCPSVPFSGPLSLPPSSSKFTTNPLYLPQS